MRKLSVLFFVFLLIVVPVHAVTTLAASLNGANERPGPGDPDGSGFALAIIDADAGTVRFALFFVNVPSPTAAHIHRGTSDVAGPIVVNFAPTFENGTASGTITTTNTALLNEIIATPGGFYVNIHSVEFPAGAIRGQLVAAASDATDAVFPIAGRVAGANGTFYRTDVSLLNLSGEATSVVFEFYPSGHTGNDGPRPTRAVELNANEQKTLNGDVLQNLLGIGDGTGAIRIIATRNVIAVARIYNDQRARDGGTLSQFVAAMSGTSNRTTGALPMLSNATGVAGLGYRTNVGWFNSGGSPVTATFRAHDPSGTVLHESTRVIAPRSQLQVPLADLIPGLHPLEDLYVTFTTSGGPLYVYASVVDNTNGDAIFIPAQ
ncbi:MAG TPA: CHRD domain-containing protein [Thermoanaerobaculia bacterium]|nr:CHRD domain-containing protein [Thermoanaerobaculia bacterium]